MKGFPVEYPVIQAPMLGITSPEMVAAVSCSGCLGSLPLGGLSPEKTAELIRKTKELTDKPFAVNLFAHSIPAVDKEVAESMQGYLYQLGMKYQIPFKQQPVESIQFHSYREQIDILLSEGIKVVSFTFGILDNITIHRLKQNHVILMGTATCLEEALLLDKKDVDIIVAQGIEAGGHRGTFVGSSLPQIGLMSLLPEIIENTSRPVIAAGGIADAKAIHAAFMLGAQGVQAGSVFIASNESLAVPSYKAVIQQATQTDTVLTRCFSGRWARSIRNCFIDEMEQSGLTLPDYPIQNSLTTPLRTTAQQADNKDFISLYAGESANKAQSKPVSDIISQLIKEMR